MSLEMSTAAPTRQPRPVCNAATGVIDAATVQHWKKYDISLNLRTNWNKSKPRLAGKIRVSVGEPDNFLSNHAVHLLDDEMKKLNVGLNEAIIPEIILQ